MIERGRAFASPWMIVLAALGGCSEGQSVPHDPGSSDPAGAGMTSGGVENVGGSATIGGTSSNGGTTTGTATTVSPQRLSETGLYESDGKTLRSGVLPYTPRFELWSDGATKNRYLSLPAGAQIDTSDPDYFNFPVGTKLWKEFTRDNTRIETRLIERVTTRTYRMIAYVWNAAGTDAVATPGGLANAKGTAHDVPSEADCLTCHQHHPGKIIGVSAVQLDHNGPGVTMDSLAAAGRLSMPVPPTKQLPGDATAQAALGALHVNCGTCHNPRSVLPYKALDLWLRTSGLASVEETSAYRSAVNVASGSGSLLIVPGQPDNSVVFSRLSTRGNLTSMPPLGTELVDDSMVASVRAFIAQLR